MREGNNEKIAEDIPRFLAENNIDSVSQLENFLTQADEDSTPLQEQLVKFNSWTKKWPKYQYKLDKKNLIIKSF